MCVSPSDSKEDSFAFLPFSFLYFSFNRRGHRPMVVPVPPKLSTMGEAQIGHLSVPACTVLQSTELQTSPNLRESE